MWKFDMSVITVSLLDTGIRNSHQHSLFFPFNFLLLLTSLGGDRRITIIVEQLLLASIEKGYVHDYLQLKNLSKHSLKSSEGVELLLAPWSLLQCC